MTAVITSIITGIVALVTCTVSNHYQNNKTQALIEYKIDELTKRVDKHNSVVERTYRLEQSMAVAQEKIAVANHRIEDLETK